MCVAHITKQMRSWSWQSLRTLRLSGAAPQDEAALGFLLVGLPHCGLLCPSSQSGLTEPPPRPNLLLLSYSVRQRKSTKEGSSLGHPKGRGSKPKKESGVPLSCTNAGTFLTHEYHSTWCLARNQQMNASGNGVTIATALRALDCDLVKMWNHLSSSKKCSSNSFPRHGKREPVLPMPPTSAKDALNTVLPPGVGEEGLSAFYQIIICVKYSYESFYQRISEFSDILLALCASCKREEIEMEGHFQWHITHWNIRKRHLADARPGISLEGQVEKHKRPSVNKTFLFSQDLFIYFRETERDSSSMLGACG